MTEGPPLCGNDWVYQLDNGAVHCAHLTKDFFHLVFLQYDHL